MKTYNGQLVKVGCYPLSEPNTFSFKDKNTGVTKEITNTHRLAVQLDDDSWMSFGNTNKEDFIVPKQNGDGYSVLGAGSEVFFTYEEKKAEDGRVFRNAKKSNLTVIKLVEGVSYSKQKEKASKSNSSDYTPKDQTGMHVGHAQKGAVILNQRHKKDLIKSAMLVVQVTENLKNALVGKGKSEYEAGQEAGNAVINACQLVTKTGDLEEQATKLLEDFNPVVTEFVKSFFSESKEVESTPNNSNDAQPQSSAPKTPLEDDWDDDIPF